MCAAGTKASDLAEPRRLLGSHQGASGGVRRWDDPITQKCSSGSRMQSGQRGRGETPEALGPAGAIH